MGEQDDTSNVKLRIVLAAALIACLPLFLVLWGAHRDMQGSMGFYRAQTGQTVSR